MTKILALVVALGLVLTVAAEAGAEGTGPDRWIERLDVPEAVPAMLGTYAPTGELMFCATAEDLAEAGIETDAALGCELAMLAPAVMPAAEVCARTTAGWCSGS